MGGTNEARPEYQTSRVLARIYESTLQCKYWPDALETLAREFRGSAAVLVVHDAQTYRPILFDAWNISEYAVSAYCEHFHKVDILGPEYRRLPAGAIRTVSELVPDIEYFSSTLYNEHLKAEHVERILTGLLMRSADYIGYVSIARADQRDDFDDHAKRHLQFFMSHLTNALNMRIQFREMKMQRNAAVSLLDTLSSAVFLLDTCGRVVQENHRAREMRGLADGLTLRANGHIGTASSEENRRLCELIDAALQRTSDNDGCTMSIAQPSGNRPYSVQVVPLQFDSTELLGPDFAVAVLVTDPDTVRHPATWLLAQMFDLAPCEARFLDMLYHKENLQHAANELSITANTARGYLKKIFSKTDVHSQTSLFKLISAYTVGYANNSAVESRSTAPVH